MRVEVEWEERLHLQSHRGEPTASASVNVVNCLHWTVQRCPDSNVHVVIENLAHYFGMRVEGDFRSRSVGTESGRAQLGPLESTRNSLRYHRGKCSVICQTSSRSDVQCWTGRFAVDGMMNVDSPEIFLVKKHAKQARYPSIRTLA